MKRFLITVLIIISVLSILVPFILIGSDFSNDGLNVYFFALVILVPFAATLGFVVTVIVLYKKKLRGTIYPLDKFTSMSLTGQSDVFTHKHTTKYKYRSSKK